MNEINLFVPGRLCLFGEHSDWVSEIDGDVKGCTIVSGVEQGIYVNAKKCDMFVFFDGINKIESSMELASLQSYFSDDYYKYIFLGLNYHSIMASCMTVDINRNRQSCNVSREVFNIHTKCSSSSTKTLWTNACFIYFF